MEFPDEIEFEDDPAFLNPEGSYTDDWYDV